MLFGAVIIAEAGGGQPKFLKKYVAWRRSIAILHVRFRELKRQVK